MRKIYSVTFTVIAALLLSSTPVRSEDGYCYGVRTALSGNHVEFFRLEIATGTVDVLNPELTNLTSISSATSVLDVVNDEYQIISGANDLVRLDINSGDLVTFKSLGNTQRTSWVTSAYDYVTGLIYGVEAGNPAYLVGVDESGKVVSEVIIKLGEARVRLCETYIDSERGLYMMMTNDGTLIVADINTGTIVNKVLIGPNVLFTAYSASKRQVYGLSSINEGQPALVAVDPLTDIRTDIELHGLDFNILGGSTCSIGFHETSNTYCFATSSGVWAINVLTGRAILFPLEDNRLLLQMEMYNRVKELHPIKGSVYADMNENCGDDDEPSIGRFSVLIEPGGYRAYSNRDGEVRINLPEGQYTADPQVEWPWRGACNDFGHRFGVAENGLSYGDIDFGLYPEELIEHLEMSLGSDQPLLGRQVHYRVIALNSGTTPFNGTIRFTHDALLTDFSATPAPDFYDNATADWEVDNLAIGAYFYIDIFLTVPTDQQYNGTEICASVELVGNEGPDLLAVERRDFACARIRGSLDPNDMSVYPRGFGDRGLVTQEDTTLAYTIRFQNIGSAPAFDVVIRDTLSDNIDERTLRFGASSHDYTVNLRDGKFLEFTFSNIMLPGKDEDEAGSQGFVKFYAGLYKNLPVDTEIRNSAAIYFDFNEPVITNTVLNTITESVTDVVDIPDSDELELRSLGNGLFVCRAEQSLEGRLSVYSVLGSKVFEQNLTGVSHAIVNLSGQPSGRYLIRLETGGKALVRSVAVVQ